MQDKRKFKILQKLFLFSYQILFDGNDTQFQKSLFFVPFWVPEGTKYDFI